MDNDSDLQFKDSQFIGDGSTWSTGVGYVPVLDISSFCVGQPRSYDGHAQLCNDVEQALGTAGFFVVTGKQSPFTRRTLC
jgi:hypothetical protein